LSSFRWWSQLSGEGDVYVYQQTIFQTQ